MKKGEILVSLWGYDQTNVDFYLIVDTTPKSVKIVKVGENIKPSGHQPLSEYVTPNVNDIRSDVMTKKVKVFRSSGKQYIGINSYAIAEVWNGEPQLQTHYH